ncbi:Cinnamyl-alcohol dehydrogenase [Bertholletia excelsa]
MTEGKEVIGWAARDSSGVLSPCTFVLISLSSSLSVFMRTKGGAEDVMLKVLYCEMDHTDLHQIRGLGGLVGSCGECLRILTYNGTYKDVTPTQRGFSSTMVVHQKFVVKIPESVATEQAAPLLCAGVTVYSPLREFIGCARSLGLGGVDHVGVLIAKGMGHNVTVISSSERKREEALGLFGADAFLLSSSIDEMQGAAATLDHILDTVPTVHALEIYLPLLKSEGKLFIVGAVPKPMQFDAIDLILGIFTGNTVELQEILDFWAEKGLTSMMEFVKMDYANKAFERMERNDVRYRFMPDVAGSKLQ